MPKRKSDATEASDHEDEVEVSKPPRKRASTGSNASASSSGSSSSATSWKDIKLDGEDEGEVQVYDTPGEIRRKIRLLLKEPGVKAHYPLVAGHWRNQQQQLPPLQCVPFSCLSPRLLTPLAVAEKNPQFGRENGLFYAGYVYFEKRRIFEGKKKTATRIANEKAGGQELRDRRHVWVFTG
ncbi:hypothetical protein MKEN_00254900 [Mycena kentingensis (nom. inval.)]|nr:hypothetical protein MKEN_00254900 [Mycena kentingensis (nom. inval.)]